MSRDIEFQRSELLFNLTEDILVHMEDNNITKLDLTRKINKSGLWVTRFFNGDIDITISQLNEICFALGVKPIFEIKEK